MLLNLLSHGPLEKGRDASDGGAQYYNLSIDGAGLAVVADSFAALEQRIEREGRLTCVICVRISKEKEALPSANCSSLRRVTDRKIRSANRGPCV